VTFLWAGVAAPIVFTTVYLVDGATRTGYDPMRAVNGELDNTYSNATPIVVGQ